MKSALLVGSKQGARVTANVERGRASRLVFEYKRVYSSLYVTCEKLPLTVASSELSTKVISVIGHESACSVEG